CGSILNNTLRSPRYPMEYPNNLDCVHEVPIPRGMALKITFKDFLLEDPFWIGYCYGEVYEDYVKIADENYVQIGLFCGKSIGKTVFVGGRRARITFHTNQAEGRRGFLLLFTFV
ncbi:unnamed protein product, partial [Porites lobata]